MAESTITRLEVGMTTVQNRRLIDMDKMHSNVRGNCTNLTRENWSAICVFLKTHGFFETHKVKEKEKSGK
jgi:hypothetical protein